MRWGQSGRAKQQGWPGFRTLVVAVAHPRLIPGEQVQRHPLAIGQKRAQVGIFGDGHHRSRVNHKPDLTTSLADRVPRLCIVLVVVEGHAVIGDLLGFICSRGDTQRA